jgi:hypothetical protein
MSQNNKYGYGYNRRETNEGSHNSNSNRPTVINSYTFQSADQITLSHPSPLLPNHEYMALKNKAPATIVNASQATTPPRVQQYPVNS